MINYILMSKSQSSNAMIEDIYNSRNVLIKYLENEKMNCDDYNEFSISEVATMYSNNQLDLFLENSFKKCYVKYHIDKNLRPNILYDLIEELYNTENLLSKEDDLIIIIKDQPNESLQKVLNALWYQEGIFIVVFNLKHLQINILEHEFVPKHIKLNKEQKEELYNNYNIEDDSQMPEISRFDPVSAAIFLRPSQVCEIHRYSDTALISKIYRLCCI